MCHLKDADTEKESNIHFNSVPKTKNRRKRTGKRTVRNGSQTYLNLRQIHYLVHGSPMAHNTAGTMRTTVKKNIKQVQTAVNLQVAAATSLSTLSCFS